jgi:ribosomal-protein-alanine N-acetyltransferase
VNKESTRICAVTQSYIADLIRIGEETNLSPWSAQSYLEEIRNPKAILLRLVCEENETIGFVVGRLVLGGEAEVRTDAEIYNIAVVNDRQHRGNGQKLLDSFLERCSEHRVNYVWLEVRESNHKAITFYRKNGFEQIQSRPNFYENPREAALLMRLKLESEKG